MIRIDALIAQFPDLDIAELSNWIERHWVIPDFDDSDSWIFAEVDVARVRLIYDLRRDLDIAEDMVPLMLSLLDQVYDLRCALKAVNRAIARQPREMRDAVYAELYSELARHDMNRH
jgi:chaperone modulatory protein CbpM